MRVSRRALVLLFALLGAGCPPGQPMTTADGTTGTTGTTGGASETGEPTGGAALMRCEPLCDADAECRIGGEDMGFRCLEGRCVYPPCTDAEGCVADLSGWRKPCAADGECEPVEGCIDIGGGAGRCALRPGMFACADFGLQEVMRPAIAGGEPVVVCGNPNAVCEAGECRAPCTADDGCAAEMGHPTCEVASGRCVCKSDQDCAGAMVPGFVACADGRCGCRTDSDCEGGPNVDACYGGACGCASDEACTVKYFDGAALACQ
jgi:hypothetical protein